MNVARPSGRFAGRIALGAFVGALLALSIVAPAFAQVPESTASPVGASVSGFGVTEWMNLILRLGLVLVVIWFAIVAMRWWVRRMNGVAASGAGHLQIVESRSLGPNRSLQLVRLGNRAVLLGVTTEQISSVLEITDPAEVERLAKPAVASTSPTSFRDAVSRLGSLTRYRPVIERKRPARSASETAAHAAVEAGRAAPPRMPAAASGQRMRPPSGRRSRWMTLARRVIGLEEPPTLRAAVAGPRPQGAPPAQPMRPTPFATPARPPISMASAGAAAAELPASRAVRARSGYRQNQIAEAQRAITSVREQMQR